MNAAEAGQGQVHGDAVETTRQTYDAVATEYKRVTSAVWPELVRDLQAFVTELPEGPWVLDAGCGTGRDTRVMREHGAVVVGLDLSLKMLQAAELPGLIQADMRALPLRDASYHGVWCQAALLHVPRSDVGKVLGEFARILRPGGRLHLSVSEGEGEGWESGHYGTAQPRWFVHHQEDALRVLLSGVGLDVAAVSRSFAGRQWLRMLAVRSG